MTIETVKIGVITYIENNFISKIPGWRKWALGLGSAVYVDNLNMIFDNNLDTFVKLGIAKPDGQIDVESAYTLVKAQADKYGGITENLPILGEVTFTSEDIDELYKLIKKGAKSTTQ